MVLDPKSPQYALVAYLHGPVADFAEQVRAELHPGRAHLAAHVTILPPRPLKGTEEEAKQALLTVAARFSRFDIAFGDVESFAPTTPTVFIRVAKSAHRFRDMHVRFNAGPLQCEEPWPYMPHLTIVKMDDLAGSERALAVARERWADHRGDRNAKVEQITFVREGDASLWIDLATIRLKEPSGIWNR